MAQSTEKPIKQEYTGTDFEVRCCDTNELRNKLETTLYDMAAKNGWPAGYGHVTFSSLIDPEGNYVGLLNGEIVSMISAVNHNDKFAFIGTFMTFDEHQGKGFGTKVFNASIAHCGDRVIGLYAAPHMTEWYKRQGFAQTGTASIYRKQNPEKLPLPEGYNPAYIIPLKDVDFKEVLNFDRRYFPADREKFLHAWLTHPKVTSALVYVKDGVIHGYGALRKCIGDKWCKFGPLFADSLNVAEQLAVAMINALPEGIEYVQFDCLDDNPSVKALAEKLNFPVTPYGGAVLYKNGVPEFDVSGVYAYTSGAFG
ncbi:uncharacterized protein LOC129592294 [Paramacrobiotus metropolitanus]|uniref:uncharacterized protein LOC129592294 n=1 Tax=Paramacrobiotus metropolitanus TaxID=2943436 RepID=UPI002445E34F|nr:uncharacterized protein LOC129592294 [Paramacrobiotus metropolitanus]